MRTYFGLSTMNGRFAAGLVAVLAGASFSGCQKPPAPAAPPPPRVGVVDSRRMDVPVLATPNGTTRAAEVVTLRARVRGFLTERHFEEGATVKKGQLLLVIEEEPYKIALDSARAKQEESEAAVRKAEQSKAREVAASKVALDMAQLNLKQIEEQRSRKLLARNAGSQEELDRAEADRKQFEAQVQADRANHDQAVADYDVAILAAKAQLQAAKAGVRDAELNLGYCRMTSPIDGRIGVARVKVGNLVGPGQEGGSYTELGTIQQLDPITVDIQVSSRYLDKASQLVRQGLPAKLTRPGVEGEEVHPYIGECYFIDNYIDETTSTFLSKARIPNPHGTLLPGEYVKLEMKVDDLKDAIVVPASAVMETEAGPVVYIVDKDGKVAIQRVEAGLTMYQGLRVLTKGLDVGVPVIVEGLQMIRPGMPVKAEPAVLARPVEKEAVAILGDEKPIEGPATVEAAKEVASKRHEPSSEPAPSWPRSTAKKPAEGAESHPK
ncbi:MAG: efflux RND transporter periplasmic adaptor subunit [Paludisphaera borealis]|uniref:efflux RND transporter periplasmic adaptor subunit n=1 Tax=Paludisphaera borealis TaxID=1387353 RepID=UPI002844ABF2|nr:efflux RND transporter periplasmic adaptor subunit [Paludisphaera borealis]MDR3618162.1 efflux RND transporter periplasmic adaptor subunit [Paludisphaera borealis]